MGDSMGHNGSVSSLQSQRSFDVSYHIIIISSMFARVIPSWILGAYLGS